LLPVEPVAIHPRLDDDAHRHDWPAALTLHSVAHTQLRRPRCTTLIAHAAIITECALTPNC
jgi:hypothetical protein